MRALRLELQHPLPLRLNTPLPLISSTTNIFFLNPQTLNPIVIPLPNTKYPQHILPEPLTLNHLILEGWGALISEGGDEAVIQLSLPLQRTLAQTTAV